MKTILPLLALTLITGCATSSTTSGTAEGPSQLEQDLDLFLTWFPGEYDNHEQVWQQDIDGTENRHEHIHHIFAPMAAPAVGEHTFFVQQYMDGDPNNIYRQRLYNFELDEAENAIRLTIYTYNDEAKYRDSHLRPGSLRGITMDELSTPAGCEVYWQFKPEENHFHGYMKERACNVVSRRSGKTIYITDDLKLTDSEIWIRDEAEDEDGNYVFGNKDGIHHKNRKVRYFTGWAGVNPDGVGTSDPTQELTFMGGIVIHDEGQRIKIRDENGVETGYSVQLAQLTQQSAQVRVMVLKIFDDATDQAVAYSWSNPQAERLGINVRWAQTGMTLKPEHANFGFTPEQP